jgi:hypothetical protein
MAKDEARGSIRTNHANSSAGKTVIPIGKFWLVGKQAALIDLDQPPA